MQAVQNIGIGISEMYEWSKIAVNLCTYIVLLKISEKYNKCVDQ